MMLTTAGGCCWLLESVLEQNVLCSEKHIESWVIYGGTCKFSTSIVFWSYPIGYFCHFFEDCSMHIFRGYLFTVLLITTCTVCPDIDKHLFMILQKGCQYNGRKKFAILSYVTVKGEGMMERAREQMDFLCYIFSPSTPYHC